MEIRKKIGTSGKETIQIEGKNIYNVNEESGAAANLE